MTLIEHLTLVEETRSEINRKHNLVDVMFLVISAIMSGAEGWNDIETYGDSKIDWLRQHRPFANGIPRRHTVARILRSGPTHDHSLHKLIKSRSVERLQVRF